MPWSWSSIGDDVCPSHGEVVNAVATGELKWTSMGDPGLADDRVCYERDDYELYIKHDSTALGSSGIAADEIMNKVEMVTYRDLSSDVGTVTPNNFAISLSNIDDSNVLVEWTNPAEAETAWDYQIARCGTASCTPTAIILTGSVSGTNQSRLDNTTSATTFYRYRMRYHDGSTGGPWTAIQEITTGEGNEPT